MNGINNMTVFPESYWFEGGEPSERYAQFAKFVRVLKPTGEIQTGEIQTGEIQTGEIQGGMIVVKKGANGPDSDIPMLFWDYHGNGHYPGGNGIIGNKALKTDRWIDRRPGRGAQRTTYQLSKGVKLVHFWHH